MMRAIIRRGAVPFLTLLASVSIVNCGLPPVWAQVPDLKPLQAQYVPESGCPVTLTGVRTELEIDAFGAPIAARHYIDYRNVGNKPVAAVKFRIGYIDNEQKIRGMFHATDAHPLEPGGTASQKWRGEKVDPRTSSVKVRVLLVKYADGGMWESVKLQEVATPNAQSRRPEAPTFMPLTPESQDPMPAQTMGVPSKPGRAARNLVSPEPAADSRRPAGLDEMAGAPDVDEPKAAAPKAVAPPAEPPVREKPVKAEKPRKQPVVPDLPRDPAAAFDAILNQTGGVPGYRPPEQASNPARQAPQSAPPAQSKPESLPPLEFSSSAPAAVPKNVKPAQNEANPAAAAAPASSAAALPDVPAAASAPSFATPSAPADAPAAAPVSAATPAEAPPAAPPAASKPARGGKNNAADVAPPSTTQDAISTFDDLLKGTGGSP